MSTTTMKRGWPLGVVLAAVALLPALAAAQQPPKRREAPIVIHGQVPTPQVVTVRPRAVPDYSRQVLVPRFYNHDFWPEIQESYQLMATRELTGNPVLDSLGSRRGAASADAAAAAASPVGIPKFFDDSLSGRGGGAVPQPPPPPARRLTPADSARSRAGTPPARH